VRANRELKKRNRWIRRKNGEEKEKWLKVKRN
jgi:hypothetical protein